MAYADALRSKVTYTGENVAALIEGIFSSNFPLAWTSWTPTWTCSGSMTFGSVTGTTKYIQVGKLVICIFEVSGTLGGSAASDIYASPPVTVGGTSGGGGWKREGASNWGFSGHAVDATNNRIGFYRGDISNWSTGTAVLRHKIIYEAA